MVFGYRNFGRETYGRGVDWIVFFFSVSRDNHMVTAGVRRQRVYT